MIDQGSQLCEGVKGRIYGDVDMDLETSNDERWRLREGKQVLQKLSIHLIGFHLLRDQVHK